MNEITPDARADGCLPTGQKERQPRTPDSDGVRDREIARLEASMKRMDEIDPEEIEPDEYGRILDRLVKLREERDSKTRLCPAHGIAGVEIDALRRDNKRYHAFFEETKAAFAPIRDWYDGDGEREWIPEMIAELVKDHMEERNNVMGALQLLKQALEADGSHHKQYLIWDAYETLGGGGTPSMDRGIAP